VKSFLQPQTYNTKPVQVKSIAPTAQYVGPMLCPSKVVLQADPTTLWFAFAMLGISGTVPTVLLVPSGHMQHKVLKNYFLE